jgi:hypothetical protein
LNGIRTLKVLRKFAISKEKRALECPLLACDRKFSYFFSGVLAAGGVAGLALVSGFLSTGFLSSVFFSSFTGLAVGLTVTDGLEVTTGEPVTTGVDVGVVTGFIFVVVDGWHAVPIAVTAAKTVSRIDLLIVFP